ncbi:hypothetical protein GCM10010094_90460 [Streptomyces flaveus]|uniref:EVE domain-containing protein n=2 Tax=Streptomyces flaveus TaxID=66370 RepID=A0A917VUI8_9ACTN|nr:hypothetical protein GCM10010094_90460 [Streptomyces flaveus]
MPEREVEIPTRGEVGQLPACGSGGWHDAQHGEVGSWAPGATATGEIVQDWIYILNPNKDTLDGEPSDKDTVRRLAHKDPELDLWLSRRNRMNPGDRLWFFFSQPESAVAAVAEVDREPREDPDDPDFSYRVDVTLLPGPTDALYGNPVGRDELELGQVRSVQKVKPEALKILLARAGL